jgi:hypothetical protein
VRSNLIVLGFAPLNRLHIEGVAQNKSATFLLTEVGQPIPRQPTFNADDPTLALGSNKA